MMTTAISRPIEPSRTMSPNPVVVSAETGPLLFEVLQQSRFGEFLRLEQVLQGRPACRRRFFDRLQRLKELANDLGSRS
jgi:hypothetical protein